MDAIRDSLWMQTRTARPRPRLEGQHRFDVVVVGAGITGTTTALLLKRSGARVALVEMGEVCQGVTGHTTAKITSLHRLIYADVADSLGEDAARVHGLANEAAIALIAQLVSEYGIACDFERRPAFTFTLQEEQLEAVRREADVAARLGLPATFTTITDLPFSVLGAVRFDRQGQFHPRAYVLGLADQIDGDGSVVFEHSRVVDIRDGTPALVRTEHGAVEADAVVVATHLPILDRGLFFAKAHPTRSYAAAVEAGTAVPTGMHITAEDPTRSVRSCRHDGQELLILSGESHKPGADPDEASHWDELVAWGREMLGSGDARYVWSAQDYKAVDGLPYIGKLGRTATALWTATGFRKWGMSGGTAAAIILAELCRGNEHPWAGVYDSHRITPRASAKAWVSENLEVAKHFVRDRVGLPGPDAIRGLEPGQGVVADVGDEAYAVCRSGEGRLHSLSPVCTHMGCHVRWNTAESSWDCPCHGSRFDDRGVVIQGPAVRDLDEKPLPD